MQIQLANADVEAGMTRLTPDPICEELFQNARDLEDGNNEFLLFHG